MERLGLCHGAYHPRSIEPMTPEQFNKYQTDIVGLVVEAMLKHLPKPLDTKGRHTKRISVNWVALPFHFKDQQTIRPNIEIEFK